MSRCIDWPCCGHESGCCPDFDDDGNQLNMVCVCGAKLPVNNRYSICDSCMNSDEEGDGRDYGYGGGRDDNYDAWSREY